MNSLKKIDLNIKKLIIVMSRLEIERDTGERTVNVDSDFNIDDLILDHGDEREPVISRLDSPESETPTPFNFRTDSRESPPVVNYDMFSNLPPGQKKQPVAYPDNDSDSEPAVSIKSYNSYKSEVSVKMSEESVRKEKVYLLFKLKGFEKRGHPLSIRADMHASLQDLRNESARLKKKVEVERSQQLLRSMTVAGAGFLEWANNKYDPLEADLEGWTESIQINIDNYDDVFEELHEKYSDRVNVSPEFKLIGMFGMSAFMFAWSKRQIRAHQESSNQNTQNDITSAISNLQGLTGSASMSGPDNIEDVLSKLSNIEVKDTDSEKSDDSDTKQIQVRTKGRPKKKT